VDVSLLLLLLSSSLLSILLCISLPPRRTGSSSSCSTGTQVCLLTCLLAYKLAMAGMRLPTEHRATLLARFLQSPRALPCLSLSPVRSQAARRAALSPARFHPSIAPLTRPRFQFSTQVPRSSQPGPSAQTVSSPPPLRLHHQHLRTP
jgi:hypothetical protein